ncbi:MAG: hypothetical protein M1816_007580 [Peltula sp. TS41687]|nr:MAG: hypothetical protein M1816_007580 [Peltula sp. TS41687]
MSRTRKWKASIPEGPDAPEGNSLHLRVYTQYIQKQEQKLQEIIQLKEAKKKAISLKRKVAEDTVTLEGFAKESDEEVRLRQLTDELEALRRAQNEGGTENRPEDGNNLAVNAVKEGLKQWTQGVSNSVGGMIHKVTTSVQQAGGGTRSRPFGGALPNLGPIGPLVGVP